MEQGTQSNEHLVLVDHSWAGGLWLDNVHFYQTTSPPYSNPIPITSTQRTAGPLWQFDFLCWHKPELLQWSWAWLGGLSSTQSLKQKIVISELPCTAVVLVKIKNKKERPVLILTFYRGREAESIILVVNFMSVSIAAHTWSYIFTTANNTWISDWILDCPVSQPASVAPVKPVLPFGEKLFERSQSGILILTRLLGIKEVQMIAPFMRVVGEYHTWKGKRTVFNNILWRYST